MQRFFTDELLQQYKDHIGPIKYTLMNHAQFYTWWKDNDQPSPPTLTRQVSFEIATKTCRELGDHYSKKAIDKVKNDPSYDILVAVNETSPSSQDEKVQAISGFLITRYEECKAIKDVYSIHLICVKQGGIQGKLLIGAFLYCLQSAPYKIGILEVAGGYHNIPAFFSYSKMGFKKDLTLYRDNCFADRTILPMSVNVNEMSVDQIIGYSKGTLTCAVEDDTHLFETGVPASLEKAREQAELADLAQQYYVFQLADIYNKDQGEFDDILEGTTEESLARAKRRVEQAFRKYKCKGSSCAISGGTRKKRRKMRSKKLYCK